MPRPDRPHRFHALGQNSLYERAETAQPAGPSMPEITGDKVMHQIAAQVGTWNIFILNAGHLPNPTSVASANLFDCWTILTYEHPDADERKIRRHSRHRLPLHGQQNFLHDPPPLHPPPFYSFVSVRRHSDNLTGCT
ncbi:hypothetical protein HO133_008160 [Letharia lupina]|uniref:Uncharacterized protein n=1 Tax=Letharia lupina TaxID=560253 RepID=A0A8H6CRN9_9LECA|nr:uncharacterized protein HO133_008160 [Letharia lupina]KAF6228430.1 hypothetical protein HO133_008160 [Letharia lupina]